MNGQNKFSGWFGGAIDLFLLTHSSELYAMDQEGSNERCHGRSLNFNAPLLSTRRLAAAGSINAYANADPCGIARDISKRIPFSWERSLGMPKDDIEKSDLLAESPPPPKLPSGRWCPPTKWPAMMTMIYRRQQR
uniref:Uncharacterized protein n=1 Tax=Nelumbo nucifera TaxID=4432 RepID=A0A822YDF5_NELNU|nr:TPA_asm: hypothetical protein HUJ06_028986 [Nelumbo nucifera]